MSIVKPVSTPARRASVHHEATCVSCGYLLTEEPDDEERLCSECRAPLRFLAFPDEYCDLGGGD